MQFYQLFMFLHIACVVVWLGSGLTLLILGAAAVARRDTAAIVSVASRDVAVLTRIFGPAALGALLCGLAMTWIAWDFQTLWILIGLVGFAGSAVYGGTVIRQASNRLSSAIRKYGPESTLAAAEAQRLLVIGRFDTILLTVVVADMVFKPDFESASTLALMAAVLVGGGFMTWRGAQSVSAPPPRG